MIPCPKTPPMYGVPGFGLSSSGFNESAVQLGQLGEVNFSKALYREGLLTRFPTFWSLHMLGQDIYSKEDSDVDCAIITGQRVWLIDLKYYSSGDVTYVSTDGQNLVTIDNATGAQVGNPKPMSHNMKMAIERFNSRYKNYSYPIEARVVLVPTDKGQGTV